MILKREILYQAIFDLLSGTEGFSSYWRGFVPIQQLVSSQMPALMMRQVKESRNSTYGLPPKYNIDIDVGILCETQSDMSGSVPASVINPLIDAVEEIMLPENIFDFAVSLGFESVSRIWIEGDIEIIETIPGSSDRTFALIPIKVISQ